MCYVSIPPSNTSNQIANRERYNTTSDFVGFPNMAPRSSARRPGRQRRRPGMFARNESGHFSSDNVPRSNISLKPREERPYQDFHPDLDVSAKLLVISSTEPCQPPPVVNTSLLSVVPLKRKAERPLTPVRTSSRNSIGKNGSFGSGKDGLHTNGVNGTHSTPNGVSIDGTNDTPDTPIPDATPATPLPIHDRSPVQILRHNFAASLPMSRAETNVTMTQEPEFEVIAPFKNTPYIGRSMADVGYQESEYWSRPQDSYIRFYGMAYPYMFNGRNYGKRFRESGGIRHGRAR